MGTTNKLIVVKGQPIPAKRVTKASLWRARDYSDYKESLAWEFKKALKPQAPIYQDITIKRLTFYRKSGLRADIDNLLKTVMESLALSGYIANDRQVVGVERMWMEHNCSEPRIELEL